MRPYENWSKQVGDQEEVIIASMDCVGTATRGTEFQTDIRILWLEESPGEIIYNRSDSGTPDEQNAERAEEARSLLRCFAEGDSTAFWKLWEGYRKHLFGVCLRQMGGNREEAEDALSRAMLKALERLPFYAREVTNPKAWLTRLIRNLCLDIHRERERRARGMQGLEEITVLAFDRIVVPAVLTV